MCQEDDLRSPDASNPNLSFSKKAAPRELWEDRIEQGHRQELTGSQHGPGQTSG